MNQVTDNKPFVPNLPSRNDVIIEWCRNHRPDIVDHVTRILPNLSEAEAFLLSIAFGAGREFQVANPNVSIHQGV